MPETAMIDEVVAERAPARASIVRPMVSEAAGEAGAAKVMSGAEEDTHGDAPRRGRAFKESTEKLLAEFDGEGEETPALAPHEVGDADEDAPDEDADADDADDAGEGGEEGEGEEAEEEADEGDEAGEIRATAARLEQRNRELLAELDTARKTPKVDRTARETTLIEAEQAYIEEGTVPALRKFLSAVVGAAPDSKEVDAELAGLYLDLTSREVGVALDQNQQTLRDNARTRLMLARDKREKAEAVKKVEPGNGAEPVQYEQAAKYIDNLLSTKGQGDASIADEYPMLMTLAQDFDGFAPGEVLARAIRQEIMAGTLDPNDSEIKMIRTVAPKIEKHYDNVAKKIEAARSKKNPKPDTTTPSGKQPKVATAPSQEAAPKPGARTITNATASKAPAKLPKATKQKADTTEKTRKDFPSEAAWKEHLLSKHFQS